MTNPTELVQRIRGYLKGEVQYMGPIADALREAADTIERQAEALSRLKSGDFASVNAAIFIARDALQEPNQ